MTQSPASLRAILIAACLGFLVVQLDVSVVNVGLGALKAAFNADLTGLQWVINSYALPFSALLILGGAWGDKWGAKTVFAAGFAIFTLASIGCGLGSSMKFLISMRVIQGMGAALLIPTSLTLIRVSFQDPDRRRSAVALWGACGGIALAAGPVSRGPHGSASLQLKMDVRFGSIAAFPDRQKSANSGHRASTKPGAIHI